MKVMQRTRALSKKSNKKRERTSVGVIIVKTNGTGTFDKISMFVFVIYVNLDIKIEGKSMNSTGSIN